MPKNVSSSSYEQSHSRPMYTEVEEMQCSSYILLEKSVLCSAVSRLKNIRTTHS